MIHTLREWYFQQAPRSAECITSPGKTTGALARPSGKNAQIHKANPTINPSLILSEAKDRCISGHPV
jgi:hypothetical protein